MSTSPLVTDWMARKLKWGADYLTEDRYLNPIPLTRAPTLTRPVYHKIYDREAPEGSLVTIGAGFDSPLCGIRFEAGLPLDTGPSLTVALMILGGSVAPNIQGYALVPPTTPIGVYNIVIPREFPWLNWLRIYLFTIDTTADHVCYGFRGIVGFLLEERPPIPRVLLERLLEETRRMTVSLPAAVAVPEKIATPSMAEEVSNVKLERRTP